VQELALENSPASWLTPYLENKKNNPLEKAGCLCGLVCVLAYHIFVFVTLSSKQKNQPSQQKLASDDGYVVTQTL
jgi:hypothetical protein